MERTAATGSALPAKAPAHSRLLPSHVPPSPIKPTHVCQWTCRILRKGPGAWYAQAQLLRGTDEAEAVQVIASQMTLHSYAGVSNLKERSGADLP